MTLDPADNTTPGNPFDLADQDSYARWRDHKLSALPGNSADLRVQIADLANPDAAEQTEIANALNRSNMAIYACTPTTDEAQTRADLRSFAEVFGLTTGEKHRSAEADGIVALEVVSDGPRLGYIPYTNKPLNWHTDGYYNAPDAQIRAFILHCVRDASTGGENGLLDPEIAYVRLRDQDPALIAALMRADAMTIPGNSEKDGSIRPASVGPVFSVDASTGKLQMRYSARARNIIWRDDNVTDAAASSLLDLLASGQDCIRHRLQPGEGLICNNIIHNRSSFTNDPAEPQGRLYFRSRYGSRVRGT